MPSIGGVVAAGLIKKDHGWTKAWPTEPGWYWFYGILWPSRDGKYDRIEITTVDVRKIANGFMHVTHGSFVYEEEGHRGYFKRIEMPVIPADIAKGDLQ